MSNNRPMVLYVGNLEGVTALPDYYLRLPHVVVETDREFAGNSCDRCLSVWEDHSWLLFALTSEPLAADCGHVIDCSKKSRPVPR